MSVLWSAWGIILIFLLFLLAYRRALSLINPLKQLQFIAQDSTHEMQAWSRRAKRFTKLINWDGTSKNSKKVVQKNSHDLTRIKFFQANPHWITGANQSIQYVISFARR